MEPGQRLAAENVPVQMEYRLPRCGADVHDDTVVVQPGACGGLGNEAEHSSRFLIRECCDVAHRVDVPCGQDEQMRLGGGSDVTDRDEPLRRVNVLTLGDEAAKEAVRLQRRAPLPT